MRLFLGCVKNEFGKLLHKKKYMVFLLIEVIFCVCVLLIQAAVNRAMDGEIVLQAKNMSLGMLTFFIQVYVPLVLFMACCDLFSAEMQDNSIKAVLMRPVSRFKIFFAKTLAIAAFAVLYLAALFLVTTILEVASSGTVARFWSSLGAYLLDIIPLLILVLMAVLVNQVTKSSSMAMFLCILLYVVLCIVGIVIPEASGLLFTGYMQWHKLWLGAILPFGAMLAKIGLLCGYGLVFGGAGFLLFDRRDF